jgi:hypothetical protein
MTNEIKHENPAEKESFEHQDLQASGVLYFLLSLGVATLLAALFLVGVYKFLGKREKANQPAVSPLLADVPQPVLKTKGDYEEHAEKAFPDPRLETDERNQLNKIRGREDGLLNSYGWVDEKAGTVRIPIERAMDLLVQRGLPVRPQDAASNAPTAKTETTDEIGKNGTGKKGEKK